MSRPAEPHEITISAGTTMRHVIQLTGPVNNLVALCDDGTMWTYRPDTSAWTQLPSVPGQPAITEASDAMPPHDRAAIERQERAEQARRDRFEGKP
ncbi:MAG TPA: hypothetical protein VLI40_10900 [Gemmatimonadaceae bacterium]|nr:hypothetical protein [Gemmatimonadaceae bacterium]